MNTARKVLVLIFCFLFIVSPVSAAIIYVSEAGAGNLDGTSWANAHSGSNLQAVINGAAPGDNIWVTCGSYYPTLSNDRTIYFSMRNNISIFGSFQGTESNIEDRDLTCGPCSQLDGDINTSGLQTDNSYTVIVNYNLNNTALLDGFVVVNGYDNRSVSSYLNGLGGGVYNGGAGGGEGGSCSPTFNNCVFQDNYAAYGAGMFNNGHNSGNSAPILSNCIFTGNVARIGGGAMDSYGWRNGSVAPSLTNCIMYNNSSQDRAGAMYCWGGLNGNCSVNIVNSAFVNNTSTKIAGGIIVDNSDNLAGNPPFSGTANIEFINSIAWGNTSDAGPQFYILGSGNFVASYSIIDTVGQTNSHPISGSGIGNLFDDPDFLNIASAIGIDGCWMTNDDGLTINISSEGINAGTENLQISTDLKNDVRIIGTAIDIGPYEFLLPENVNWTGLSGTDWFLGNNWAPTRVPDSIQNVFIPGPLSAPNQPIINNETGMCNELILDTDSNLQVIGTGTLKIKAQE